MPYTLPGFEENEVSFGEDEALPDWREGLPPPGQKSEKAQGDSEANAEAAETDEENEPGDPDVWELVGFEPVQPTTEDKGPTVDQIRDTKSLRRIYRKSLNGETKAAKTPKFNVGDRVRRNPKVAAWKPKTAQNIGVILEVTQARDNNGRMKIAYRWRSDQATAEMEDPNLDESDRRWAARGDTYLEEELVKSMTVQTKGVSETLNSLGRGVVQAASWLSDRVDAIGENVKNPGPGHVAFAIALAELIKRTGIASPEYLENVANTFQLIRGRKKTLPMHSKGFFDWVGRTATSVGRGIEQAFETTGMVIDKIVHVVTWIDQRMAILEGRVDSTQAAAQALAEAINKFNIRDPRSIHQVAEAVETVKKKRAAGKAKVTKLTNAATGTTITKTTVTRTVGAGAAKKPVKRKGLPNVRTKEAGSYFGTCERDDEGHCLPSGKTGSSGGGARGSRHESSGEADDSGSHRTRHEAEGKLEYKETIATRRFDHAFDVNDAYKAALSEVEGLDDWQPGMLTKFKAIFKIVADEVKDIGRWLMVHSHDIAPEILDVAADYQKIFYAGRNHGPQHTAVVDPFLDAGLPFGSSAMAPIAATILTKAAYAAKGALGKKAQPTDDGKLDSKAEKVAMVLNRIYAALGVNVKVDPAKVAEFMKTGKADPAARD